MRVPTNLTRGGLGFNMTPMIDVVFLLIIFFLVSSHLAQQESQLPLDLPGATSGETAREDETRRIVINVVPDESAEGQIVVAGQRMQNEQLAELIRYERDRDPDRELEVRIRTDRRVNYGIVQPIMRACVDADVWDLTFAVIEEIEE